MAGTSWDKLGQMDQAFEAVAPAIRQAAATSGARLHEFFRDDPVWRLDFSRRRPGDPAVDISWSEDAPEQYTLTALWWEGETLRREPCGGYSRESPLAELEAAIASAVARLPG